MAKTNERSESPSKFVVDGYSRAWNAMEPEIRFQVEREFHAELQSASFFKRLLVRHKMRHEVARRIHETAPPDALY